jgi:hypothetical protein
VIRAVELSEEFRQLGDYDATICGISTQRNNEVRDLVEREEFDWIVIAATSHKQCEFRELATGEVRKVMDWTALAALTVCRWVRHYDDLPQPLHTPQVLLVMPKPSGNYELEVPWHIARVAADEMIQCVRVPLFVVGSVEEACDIVDEFS